MEVSKYAVDRACTPARMLKPHQHFAPLTQMEIQNIHNSSNSKVFHHLVLVVML